MLLLWVKAFHIIAVVCWFAGLFYLPRLFVYHAMSDEETGKAQFKVMERKLYRGIMTPSMIATIALGAWLISLLPGGYISGGWLHAKLTLIGILVGYHLYCGVLLRKFRDDLNTHSHVFYRWFNEFPVLILIAVVILVVVKPF
ncbi:MAG: protoporphyrinogen oxidase HemJ [Hahellaceae bacterium]|nr:protoporphyrinogen oxidase HemJ [Hahellaceae bacterium]MCP5168514.1 protoporphyrinogen oxidase HemJ [Hahellaceae bacterium]